MGRQHRPVVAWYGDLDFMPHLKEFVRRGAVDAVVTWGEPIAYDGTTDRKTLVKSLEGTVRRLSAAARRDRPSLAGSAA
ncbi:MAG: lyso-ornithine lipid O-acyltransferase [Bradyrhizobium sp.]|nr:lyso-ornithine lipid O-acyltransferase [Bradyrhizobium sp.]